MFKFVILIITGIIMTYNVLDKILAKTVFN